MVRTVKNHNHHHQDEEDDEDYISRTTYASSHNNKGGRGSDQKMDSYRSKHSETEQRRRSKINERFQILRDLIPENDQKRDRASFLLEVIQYIEFLQGKLQVYEGTYQGWTPEPSKLMPWRGNCGTDNFADQPQPIQNGSIEEEHGAARAVSVDMPLHPNRFEAEPSNTPQGSFPDIDLLASHSRSQSMNAVHLSSEGTIYNCTPGELEESSISNTYSKGLLNNLTLTLGSSGVDLSQASISVQFDIRKGTSSYTASTSSGVKDHGILSLGNQATTHCGVRRGGGICNQAHKRPRTENNHQHILPDFDEKGEMIRECIQASSSSGLAPISSQHVKSNVLVIQED